MSDRAQQMQHQKVIPPLEYSDEQIIAALAGARGMVTIAAKQLGCAPSTIYRRVQASQDVASAITQERERTLDFAEVKLIDQINKGNVTALIFYLKTQGKRRGYVERTEVVNIPSEIKQLMESLGVEDESQMWGAIRASLETIKQKREEGAE